jgi:hypothetical protein
MSNLSLAKSIRSCKVETGIASNIQSDRFLNPNQMVCIPWNGMNNKGQSVCPDSQLTKTAGCNSAEDRVIVENNQRPQYIDYVTLNAAGIKGHIYGNEMQHEATVARKKDMKENDNLTGNFGIEWGAVTNYKGCMTSGGGSYQRAMAQIAQQNRKSQMLNQNYDAYSNTRYSGF